VGLAADLGFTTDDSQQRAHQEAPGCALEFPVEGEPWHVEPA
jgi:hypothetical protein